jgi:hypothetical protein
MVAKNGPGAHKPKGALAKGATRRKAIGPLQTVRITHASDGAELDLALQAVVKQDMGAGCTVYVLMHTSSPS